MRFSTSFIVLGLLASGAVLAAPAEELVQPCTACHGTNGVATQPATPHLDGQISGYLEQEISALAGGERKSAVDGHIPKSWSRSDISAAARFFATSKVVRPKQNVDPAKVASGMAIYKQRCADCHVDSGRGSDKDAPLMAAQNADYLRAQTQLFVAGKRRFPFMMDDAYKGLDAEQLEAVTQYFASQEQAVQRKRK